MIAHQLKFDIIGGNPAQGLTLAKNIQVRMCGSSVCPPQSTVLVLTNLADMTATKEKTEE